MASNDKTAEAEKFRLADASAVPAPPASIKILNKDGDKHKYRSNNTSTPGAVAMSNSASRERTRTSGQKFSNLIRNRTEAPSDAALGRRRKGENEQNGTTASTAPGAFDMHGMAPSREKESGIMASLSSKSAGPSTALRDRIRRSKDAKRRRESDTLNNIDGESDGAHSPGKLVEAEVAKDVDVEALANERFQQMVVGVAAVEVEQDDDDDDEEEEYDDDEENNEKRRNICMVTGLVGLLIVAGAVVGTVALQNNGPTEATTPQEVSSSTPSSNAGAPTPSPTISPSAFPTITGATEFEVSWLVAAYGEIDAKPGDFVTFEYDEFSDLWIHPTGDCRQDGSVLVRGIGPASVTYRFTQADAGNTITFASNVSDNCQEGQIISFNVAHTRLTRAQKVDAILADLVPGNEQAISWLKDTDTWEPDSRDPSSDYLWLERYVMADFYYSTGGPTWNRRVNWLSSEPVCNWYFRDSLSASGTRGECSSPITDLLMNGNRLTSNIPSSIGSLTLLTSLALRDNQLTSGIPSSIGNLSLLKNLILDNNELTSSIPSSIGNLTLLTFLNLNFNQLTSSIPSSIGNLSLLSSLALNRNQLTSSIPSSIGKLSQLTGLGFWNNQLTSSIPSSIENLSLLNSLHLGGNQLTSSIPRAIRNLTLLTNLDFGDNQLSSSIPSSIGNLSLLRSLHLGDNQLVSTIPSSIRNLTLLTTLDLGDNQLTSSIPSSIGELSLLTSLYLNANKLSGSIPALPKSILGQNFCQLSNNCFDNLINGEIEGCVLTGNCLASIPTQAPQSSANSSNQN